MSVKLSFLKVGKDSSIALLTLSRPDVSNAFNAEMVDTMRGHLEKIGKEAGCRLTVLRGAGKNFCAGGDLQWMKESARLPERENLAEARRFAEMFAMVYELPVPTVALVQGACYGGGVGLVSVCDWAIALEDAKFCLSEVKVGVVAAIILPYVSQKIAMGHLHRLVITGRVFSATEAREVGLAQRVVSKSEVDDVLREEIGQVLAGSPQAQATFKKMHHSVRDGGEPFWKSQAARMVSTLARLRASESGQEGLGAFLSKRPPKWVVSLPKDWKLPEGSA